MKDINFESLNDCKYYHDHKFLTLKMRGRILEKLLKVSRKVKVKKRSQPEIMNKNDILRRIRYVFDFSDLEMISIFAQADHPVKKSQIIDWLKKEDDPAYQKCNDTQMAIFLNGLINKKRGKRDGPQPDPEKSLTNNAIFMKLKIALNLKADDVIKILALADVKISKHELSAFFRRPDNRHYRECKNQILRNFLKGLQLKYRPGSNVVPEDPWNQHSPS